MMGGCRHRACQMSLDRRSATDTASGDAKRRSPSVRVDKAISVRLDRAAFRDLPARCRTKPLP